MADARAIRNLVKIVLDRVLEYNDRMSDDMLLEYDEDDDEKLEVDHREELYEFAEWMMDKRPKVDAAIQGLAKITPSNGVTATLGDGHLALEEPVSILELEDGDRFGSREVTLYLKEYDAQVHPEVRVISLCARILFTVTLWIGLESCLWSDARHRAYMVQDCQ